MKSYPTSGTRPYGPLSGRRDVGSEASGTNYNGCRLPTWRHPGQLPQGGNAARVTGLWRVRGESSLSPGRCVRTHSARGARRQVRLERLAARLRRRVAELALEARVVEHRPVAQEADPLGP